MKKCDGWCAPVQIYIAIAIISTTLSLVGSLFFDSQENNGTNMQTLSIGHLIGVLFWSFILYTLCKYCYKKTAWVVLLFPLISVVMMLFLISVSKIA